MQDFLQAKKGRYGEFGGTYLPELLMAPIKDLEQGWKKLRRDRNFQNELRKILNEYAGRPTALTEIKNIAKQYKKSTRIFLKREDLLHTGAHKINNALGQCLLAKKLGKTRIVAETGAGQHGVATAAACAYLNMPCVVYMGKIDAERQAPNVARIKLLGATIKIVEQGSQTLKDAVNEALRDWSETFADTHYCLGSALGPHPYPEIVAEFQSVIGNEAIKQCQQTIGRLPDYVIACVGGGSNAIGIFAPFIKHENVKLIGVEAGGKGEKLGEHAARFRQPAKGVLHGCFTYLLQDEHGQIVDTHSISAGLDYPALGPQHAALSAAGRVEYTAVSDEEALHALRLLSSTEGIIPALESSHAIAYALKLLPKLMDDDCVVINLSGRGDKDLLQLMQLQGKKQ